MKMISMLLCFCFSLNVLAASNLEEVYNDYQYSMTVEWDQKDQDFRNAKTEEFYKNMDALMASGLTTSEMMNFVEKKVSNKKAFEEMKAQAAQANSTQELAQIFNQNMNSMYAQGASWNGSNFLPTAVIVVISALFVYSIFFTIKYGCKESVDGGPYTSCKDSALN